MKSAAGAIYFMKRKRSTIVDVAKRAGVSLGTASRVLNNRRGVDEELRGKVTDAVRTLRYVRAAGARPAERDSAPIVTFVLSNRDFRHLVHGRMLQGSDQYCSENGYFVVFKKLDYSPDAPVADLTLPRTLREHGMADCLILAGTNYPNLIRATERAGVPYVIYRNNLITPSSRPNCDQVRSSDGEGALGAVRYLIRLGHKNICYIGDISQPWYQQRYHSYLEAMKEAGLEPSAQTVALSPDNFSNGFASGNAILRHGLTATAIFAGADDVAWGVWQSLRQRGLRVPEDVSLMGFGDLPDSTSMLPALTTVRIPFLEIGRQLACLAFEKAKSPGKKLPELVVPTELMLRDTTWPLLNAAIS